jgi:hypothetical protein
MHVGGLCGIITFMMSINSLMNDEKYFLFHLTVNCVELNEEFMERNCRYGKNYF